MYYTTLPNSVLPILEICPQTWGLNIVKNDKRYILGTGDRIESIFFFILHSCSNWLLWSKGNSGEQTT